MDGTYLPGNHGFDWVGTNLPFGQTGSCDPDSQVICNVFHSVAVYRKLHQLGWFAFTDDGGDDQTMLPIQRVVDRTTAD